MTTVATSPFLPYHCARLRGDYLQPPCAKQVALAKERQDKFPHALLGSLEHCLACKGKDIEIREAPVSHLEGKTELAGQGPGVEVVPQQQDNLQDFEEAAPLGPKEDKGMKGVVRFKDATEAERVLGPGKIPMPAPRCPKHPQEPQIGCSDSGKRAGQFMGACKICLAERKLGRKPKTAKEKMTPTVARDLAKGTADGNVCATGAPSSKISTKAGSPGPEHPCPEHPENERHRDKNDRLLPVCKTCYSIQGKKNLIPGQGCKAGNVVLAFPEKYAEVGAWFWSQVEENVRTPQEQLIYLCKRAMAAAKPE